MRTAGSPKVMMVTHTSEMGGAEWSMLDYARNSRLSVTVCLLADGLLRKLLDEAKVGVHVLPASPKLSSIRRMSGVWRVVSVVPDGLKVSWRLASVARQHDVIYANSQKALFFGVLAGLLSRRRVVWHQRDILSVEGFRKWHRIVVVFLCNWAVAKVVANSQATRRSLAVAGVQPKKIVVVYNGIDRRNWLPISAEAIALIRAELGLPFGGFVVGLFGRIAPWKGQHVLLRALARLPDVHAIVVGDALFGEDVYKGWIDRLSDELDVRSRVRHLGFRSDVPELMQAVDVVVHTSTEPEPFGRVIVEGMLSGRPVIASRGGGVGEIVRSGVTGIIVEPADDEELAVAVQTLRDDEDLRTSLASAGLCHASEKFTVEAMAEEIDLALNGVIDRSESSR